MDDGWATVIEHHWPWLIPVVILGFVLAKAVPVMRSIGNWILSLIKRLPQQERERVNAKIGDLEVTVNYLQLQIGELRYRDEMTWAWILSDQEWHRKVEFDAIDKGWELPPHVSYMEFREEWIKQHPSPYAEAPLRN